MRAGPRIGFLFLGLLLGGPAASAAESGTDPALGSIRGTVAWAGAAAASDLNLGDIHAFDIEGHPEVTAGLEDAVVIAEPLDSGVQRWFQTHAPEGRALNWDTSHENRVATTAPEVSLAVSSTVALRFYLGNKLVQTVAASRGDSDSHIKLPAGIIRVLDSAGRVGWVYVTPYPTQVSNGKCRFLFHVPHGRYRLRAWHPRLGEQVRTVSIAAGASGAPLRLQLLIFRRAKRAHG